MSTTGPEVSIPEGWKKVSDWCIRSADGSATICKVFVSGWVYELWIGKNQIAVGMSTAQDAIRLHGQIVSTMQVVGTSSSASQDGDQVGQLSFLESG